MDLIMRPASLIATCMIACGGVALPAQQVPPQYPPAPTRPAPPDDSTSEDIVVEGYRLRPDIETSSATATETSAVRNRQQFEYSTRVAGCAGRNTLSSQKWFKATVDGAPNTPTQAAAQDRLKRIYITCSESPTLMSFTAPPPSAIQLADAMDGTATNVFGQTDPFPLGRSLYDRGAFVIEAIKRFAPDLKLTRSQTGDASVQERFNAREIPLNRHRLPADYRFFEIAVCMVRQEPRLAIALAMRDGPAFNGDLQAALIDRTRVCVGNARRVRVDATQFRIYIADAVYRWAVAARGVDSLISD